jgi:hypothetical protein
LVKVYIRLLAIQDKYGGDVLEFGGVYPTLEEAQKIYGPKDAYHTRRKWAQISSLEWRWKWWRVKEFHVVGAVETSLNESVDTFLHTLQTLMSSED